jgi:hypothetical protein
MGKEQFTLGQWVSVKAEVVTAREYKKKIGDREYVDWEAKGGRDICSDFRVIHRPSLNLIGVKTCLLRRELSEPRRMMVVGKTYRATGVYWPGISYDPSWRDTTDGDTPYLEEDKRHPVYMLRDTLRWGPCTLAVAEDMDAVNES